MRKIGRNARVRSKVPMLQRGAFSASKQKSWERKQASFFVKMQMYAKAGGLRGSRG